MKRATDSSLHRRKDIYNLHLILLIILFFMIDTSFPQQKDFHKLPLPDAASVNSQYRLIQIKENKFLLFTLENYSLLKRVSSDAGITWSNREIVIEGTTNFDKVSWFDIHDSGNDIIYLLYQQRDNYGTFLKVSTDLGVS